MRFLKRTKGNKGASTTVEFIFIILLVFVVFLLIIDSGVYFGNRSVFVSSAQNGARLAALYGGASNTPIARQYGAPWPSNGGNCSRAGANNLVSCTIVADLMADESTMSARVHSVRCGPEVTSTLGERTWCEIKWSYQSFTPFFRGIHTTRMSAESEVIYR